MHAVRILWANHIPKNIGPFAHKMKAYKKFSFDIKGFLYTKEFTPYYIENSMLQLLQQNHCYYCHDLHWTVLL